MMPERPKSWTRRILREPSLREIVRSDPEFFIESLTQNFGAFPTELPDVIKMQKAFDELAKNKKLSAPETVYAQLYLDLARNEQQLTFHTKADPHIRDESLVKFLAFRKDQQQLARKTKKITSWLLGPQITSHLGITHDEGKQIIDTLNNSWRTATR